MGQIWVTKVKRIAEHQVQSEIIHAIESSRNSFVKKIKDSQNKDVDALINIACDSIGKRYSTGIMAEKHRKVYTNESPDHAGEGHHEMIFLVACFTSIFDRAEVVV